MSRAYLGLGSNVGERLENLKGAVAALAEAPGVTVVAVSGVYRTEPVGREDQPEYLNAVVAIETGLTPSELLLLVNRIERSHGRKRDVRWGPRTLDIDILLFGMEEVNEADLEIPHPRMSGRRFVLVPLAELAPGAVLPDGTPVVRLLEGLADGGRVALDPDLVLEW